MSISPDQNGISSVHCHVAPASERVNVEIARSMKISSERTG
jgi:hypothetical protein